MKLPTLILKENITATAAIGQSIETQIQLPEVRVIKVKIKDVKHSMYHKKTFNQVN